MIRTVRNYYQFGDIVIQIDTDETGEIITVAVEQRQ